MKVKNLMGNVYQGSIGKSITASTWKGRNYLKKWFKPTNPNSALQAEVRGYMGGGVTLWHGWTSAQKRAFFWFERYRKKNISPFNSMIGSFIANEKASPGTYVDPPNDDISFEDSITHNPIGNVKCIVRKVGQATDYLLEYSLESGSTPTSISPIDENYDLFAWASGYTPFVTLDKTAVQIATAHDLVAI